jgi:hypothetical protein
LVVEKVVETQSVSKRASNVFTQRFNPKKLDNMDVKEQYRDKIPFEILNDDNLDISRARESTKENIKTSAREREVIPDATEQSPS